jgi:hypothetical protein
VAMRYEPKCGSTKGVGVSNPHLDIKLVRVFITKRDI